MNSDTSASVNVASHLAALAGEQPDRAAVFYPPRGVNPVGVTHYDSLTFRQLNVEADAVAHGLAKAGITRGTRVAVMVPPCLEFFTLVFGLFKAAAVPVLVDSGLGVNAVGGCLAEAGPTAFIGSAKANVARRLFGWARKSIAVTVNVGRRRLYCHHTLAELTAIRSSRRPFPMPVVTPKEPAAVLFTSGSTGPAKGAVYTHGNFAAQVDALKTAFGIRPGEVDLCTFPLFALFGPALGMTCVVPDMDFSRPGRIDPEKAIAQIRQFEVTNLFGSPAVLRRFGDAGPAGYKPAGPAGSVRPPVKLDTLKRVISAGAPVPADVVEAFIPYLTDGAEVFTPYGATEALPVTNIGSREILSDTRKRTDDGKGVCVGRPVDGTDVRVIGITDKAIPDWDDAVEVPAGEVGEIVVRGPVVTRQYHNRPEATKLAKIRDGDAVWHRMGDVGYLDDAGRLWYCGRKAHRVTTLNGRLYTEMVEPVFNSVPGVARTALVGVARGGLTYPVLCVEMMAAKEFTGRSGGAPFPGPAAVAEALLAAGAAFEHTARIETFLVHPGFPVDVRHNSKIAREKLAAWADRQLGPSWHPVDADAKPAAATGAPE